MDIIFTLYEGDYHLGVATLLHSAALAGFKGIFVVGYRDSLPPWLNQLPRQNGELTLSGVPIVFRQINPPMHFGFYKPYFALSLADDYPEYKSITYADPDVLLIAPWIFFETWYVQTPSVGIGADQNFTNLFANHPWRRTWSQLTQMTKLPTIDQQAPYANSGFVGCHRDCQILWQNWSELTTSYASYNDVTKFIMQERWKAVVSDQDLLAAALMTMEPAKVSFMGRECMGFNGDHKFLVHAIETPKPWRNRFVQNSLRGRVASEAAFLWLNFACHAQSPIRGTSVQMKLLAYKVSKLISRCWKR